jgi:serine/threonine protein kinase
MHPDLLLSLSQSLIGKCPANPPLLLSLQMRNLPPLFLSQTPCLFEDLFNETPIGTTTPLTTTTDFVVYAVKDDRIKDLPILVKTCRPASCDKKNLQIRRELLCEYVVGLYLNKLRDEIPNFVYTYYYEEAKQPCLYVEKIGNGETFSTAILHLSEEEIANIILQVLLSITTAQHRFGFIHHNLTPDNIIIQSTPSPITLQYVIGDQTYNIKTNLIAKIIDFSQSRINVDPDTQQKNKNFLPYIATDEKIKYRPAAMVFKFAMSCSYLLMGGRGKKLLVAFSLIQYFDKMKLSRTQTVRDFLDEVKSLPDMGEFDDKYWGILKKDRYYYDFLFFDMKPNNFENKYFDLNNHIHYSCHKLAHYLTSTVEYSFLTTSQNNSSYKHIHENTVDSDLIQFMVDPIHSVTPLVTYYTKNMGCMLKGNISDIKSFAVYLRQILVFYNRALSVPLKKTDETSRYEDEIQKELVKELISQKNFSLIMWDVAFVKGIVHENKKSVNLRELQEALKNNLLSDKLLSNKKLLNSIKLVRALSHFTNLLYNVILCPFVDEKIKSEYYRLLGILEGLTLYKLGEKMWEESLFIECYVEEM